MVFYIGAILGILAKALGTAVTSVGGALGSAATGVGGALGSAAQTVGSGLSGIGHGALQLGHQVGQAGQNIVQNISSLGSGAFGGGGAPPGVLGSVSGGYATPSPGAAARLIAPQTISSAPSAGSAALASDSPAFSRYAQLAAKMLSTQSGGDGEFASPLTPVQIQYRQPTQPQLLPWEEFLK